MLSCTPICSCTHCMAPHHPSHAYVWRPAVSTLPPEYRAVHPHCVLTCGPAQPCPVCVHAGHHVCVCVGHHVGMGHAGAGAGARARAGAKARATAAAGAAARELELEHWSKSQEQELELEHLRKIQEQEQEQCGRGVKPGHWTKHNSGSKGSANSKTTLLHT